MTEPTDRSMPWVPITSAMPSETMTMGVTWTNWVRKLKASRKYGANSTLNSSSASTAAYTP